MDCEHLLVHNHDEEGGGGVKEGGEELEKSLLPDAAQDLPCLDQLILLAASWDLPRMRSEQALLFSNWAGQQILSVQIVLSWRLHPTIVLIVLKATSRDVLDGAYLR